MVYRVISANTPNDKLFSKVARQGCGLGLDVSVSRRINVSSRSRLDKNFQCLGLVSVIDVSCPRPIFQQILQATILKLIKSVVAVNESLSDLV